MMADEPVPDPIATLFAPCGACGYDGSPLLRRCPVCGEGRAPAAEANDGARRTRARLTDELAMFRAEFFPVYEAHGLTFRDALNVHVMRRLSLSIDALLDSLYVDADDDD